MRLIIIAQKYRHPAESSNNNVIILNMTRTRKNPPTPVVPVTSRRGQLRRLAEPLLPLSLEENHHHHRIGIPIMVVTIIIISGVEAVVNDVIVARPRLPRTDPIH